MDDLPDDLPELPYGDEELSGEAYAIHRLVAPFAVVARWHLKQIKDGKLGDFVLNMVRETARAKWGKRYKLKFTNSLSPKVYTRVGELYPDLRKYMTERKVEE